MRVLHIVDNLSVRSGVSSIIMNIYRNIDRSMVNFDFLVMRYSENSYEEEIEELGGKITYVSNPLSIKSIFKSMKENKTFFRENSEKYTTVHLHSPTTVIFNLRYAKRYNIKNRIIHSHSTMHARNLLKNMINHLLCMNIKRYANLYWACSYQAAEFLYGHRYVKNNYVEIVNNAVNCYKFKYNEEVRNDYRDTMGLEGKYVIGHVASFNEIKNHKFLIEVFSKVCNVNEDFILVLVGSGPSFEDVVKLVKSKKIEEKVIFLGFRKDISSLLQSFDVFVLPSIKEGLPVVAVEAQASGLPCYLSSSITKEVNIGGVEYIDLEIEKWVAALMKKKLNCKREGVYKNIVNSKFNIIEEAKRVQELYLKLDKRGYKK